MNPFQKRTALRIAGASLLLASLASPVSWFVARDRAENSVVALATEESGRLLHHHDALNLTGTKAAAHAIEAAKTIVGGLFDIAEIYDAQGHKLAEAIPLSARIFAVADVFDALCSKRPYKEPMGLDAAMAILERDTGSHFDPAVMAVFREMADEVYARLENASEAEARRLLEERIRQHFEM